jgi:hypothetical protein
MAHAHSLSLDRLDLRRSPPRDLARVLTDRARWLPDPDHALVLAVYRDHRPVSEIARLRGDRPQALRRHLRALAERLLSAHAEFVAGALAAPDHAGWSPTRRRVAQLCLLEGASLRAAAADLSLSLHEVRRHRAAVLELFTEERRRTRQQRAALRRIASADDDRASRPALTPRTGAVA